MTAGHSDGSLQPNGSIVKEGTFDAKHVADAIVYIASLPLSVTVFEMNMMCVLSQCHA
jgi:NADP-dependent 3-hydroxy acid dehydrogenase YdfG